MNPTGNTIADMIFTGAMLVLHLAALAGLGYMLGRIRASRELEAAEDQRDRLTKRLDTVAAYRDLIQIELAQAKSDRNTWHDRALALMEIEDAARSYRAGIVQREEDEREWCAAGQTVSADELSTRAARLDKALEGVTP